MIQILPTAPQADLHRIVLPTDRRPRICIAGSRTYSRESDVIQVVEAALGGWSSDEIASEIVVVSGLADGPDMVGKRWADEYHIDVIGMPANRNGYGESAEAVRNGYMAQVSDALISFWDGASPGTRDMINRCTPIMPVLLVTGRVAVLSKPSGVSITYRGLNSIRAMNIDVRIDRYERYKDLIERNSAGL